jgi:hypothetical protein
VAASLACGGGRALVGGLAGRRHGHRRHARTALDGTVRAAVGTTLADVHRIFTTSVASVYPHYVTKVEKKGRTKGELDQVIQWLTGFDDAELSRHLSEGTTFEDFFADARLNPNAALITGVVCGVRVEDIDDPLMQKIRYLDKLVDELARRKPMEKILRTGSPAAGR